MAGGSKLIRACICGEYSPDALELRAPQLSCAVCQLWPAVGRFASAGEQPFLGWPGEKVPAELRGFVELKEWHGAGRLGAHFFWRGATRAILEVGGPFFQLRRSGLWRSSAYHLFLDLGHEESRAMAPITVEVSGDE